MFEIHFANKEIIPSNTPLCRAGNLPLHGAVDSGDLDAVRVVVEAGAQIDALQEDHSTPLHFACTRGALDMVQLMFELQPEKKARCLAMRDINGSTLLHIAVRFDFRNIAEFLVKVLLVTIYCISGSWYWYVYFKIIRAINSNRRQYLVLYSYL